MFKRLVCALLIVLMLTGSVAASPYAIKVNRAANTVTIYEKDETGAYTIPVKAMICSTARSPYTTPLGTYTLKEFRSEWRLMLDGTYGQYATCFQGHYLFHSICYTDDAHNAMKLEAYENLGTPASMGCVRLQTIDAKWIYDNCPAGTPVTIYDDADDPGPLGKPAKAVEHISEEMHNGWDPTDPAEGNPWHRIEAEKVKISLDRLKLEAGQTAALELTVEPSAASVTWSSSDEAVASVDGRGTVTALSAGTAKIRAEGYGGVYDEITITVKGEILPFTDLIPGAWYYEDVKGAVKAGRFSGVSDDRFEPDTPMTRAMVVQVLYNMQKEPKSEEISFEDVSESDWYYNAVAWAVTEGIVTGVSQTEFAPNKPLTRQDLAVILWRYENSPESEETLQTFTDAKKVSSYAEQAMSWAVEEGLLQGANGQLMPKKTATRVQTAVIMQRCFQ